MVTPTASLRKSLKMLNYYSFSDKILPDVKPEPLTDVVKLLHTSSKLTLEYVQVKAKRDEQIVMDFASSLWGRIVLNKRKLFFLKQ